MGAGLTLQHYKGILRGPYGPRQKRYWCLRAARTGRAGRGLVPAGAAARAFCLHAGRPASTIRVVPWPGNAPSC